MALSAEQVAQFEGDGYLIIPGFTGPEELEAMRERAEELVEGFEPQEISIFNTRNQASMPCPGSWERSGGPWDVGEPPILLCTTMRHGVRG